MRSDELPWDLQAPVPWRVGALIGLVGAYLVSFVVIGVAWHGAAGQASWDNTQLLWINVGGGGVILAGAASALWVMQGRRMVGRLRVAVLPNAAPGATAPSPDALVTGVSGDDVESGHPAYVIVPRSTMYHVPACPMVVDKELLGASSDEAQEHGSPCKICLPEEAEFRLSSN